jgi:hypothetical protein
MPPYYQIGKFRFEENAPESAHSSTAIESNPLTLEQVIRTAAGRDIIVKGKDKKKF